jgi:hypothetical protein
MDYKAKLARLILAIAEAPSTTPMPRMSAAQQDRWDKLMKKAKG